MAAGVGFAPGERATGVLPAMNVRENITLPRLRPFRRRFGRLDRRAERAETAQLMRQFEVRPADTELPFGSLSGGNQQKAVLAKWIRNQPSVLLLDEPTQGVDAGSKIAIYNAVSRAAQANAAVLVSSSDTEELVTMCDRVLVLQDGVASVELSGTDLTNARLVQAIL
jgi:ribose transport system ATP-binding protein